MLVLSRQRDETIMIGDEIEISVVDIRGDKVRLGITAPPRVAVHRKEVYEAIRAENRRAAASAGEGFGADAEAIRPGPQRNHTKQAENGSTPLTPRVVKPRTAEGAGERRRA
jgi:carbon storage regulator